MKDARSQKVKITFLPKLVGLVNKQICGRRWEAFWSAAPHTASQAPPKCTAEAANQQRDHTIQRSTTTKRQDDVDVGAV